MTKSKKTLYWDIETETKLKKVQKKTKMSQSAIIKSLVKRITFDDMVHALEQDMKNADYIDINKY